MAKKADGIAELSSRVRELQAYCGHLEHELGRSTSELRTLAYLNLLLSAVLAALVLGAVARTLGF